MNTDENKQEDRPQVNQSLGDAGSSTRGDVRRSLSGSAIDSGQSPTAGSSTPDSVSHVAPGLLIPTPSRSSVAEASGGVVAVGAVGVYSTGNELIESTVNLVRQSPQALANLLRLLATSLPSADAERLAQLEVCIFHFFPFFWSLL